VLIRQLETMSRPAEHPRREPGLHGELTLVNCGGQLKRFVNPNGRSHHECAFSAGAQASDLPRKLPRKRKSRLSAGSSCALSARIELVAALLAGIVALALAVRILLLLTGLLAPALLLAGFLAGRLILLAWSLVRIGHFKNLLC
jgi:hypothetical protein